MYSIELRNQMVIHKAKKTSLTVSTKSTVSFVTVWGLWTLSFYLIAKDHHFLFNNPIVLHWTLWEILKAALAFVLIQLVILQAWCLYVCQVMRYRRKYRSGRGN